MAIVDIGKLKRYMTLSKKYIISFLPTLLFLFFPIVVSAQATLSVSPASGSYQVGESFSVLVTLNTGNAPINAAIGQINFDNTRLEVSSLGYSQSIFSLWTDEPSFSNVAGFVKFSGGIPNPGFNGAKGNILRITFRTKATGQAPVNFLSGSVLANDGQGSNIADTLKGALYTVTPASTPTTSSKSESSNPKQKTDIVEIKADAVESEQPIVVPTITKWSNYLTDGDILVLEGLGHPSDKVVIVLQKDTGTPIEEYTFPAPDGRFIFTYPKPLHTGHYQVWAKNVTSDNHESGLSEPVTVEVVPPTFINIAGFIINYDTIIVVLLVILLLIIILCIIMWRKWRKWRRGQKIEIFEAETVLHKSFDIIQDGLIKYITYLSSAKSLPDLKKRAEHTKDELKEQLHDIEDDIAKEIKELKNK